MSDRDMEFMSDLVDLVLGSDRPSKVESVAKALHVRRILYRDVSIAGFTDWTALGPVIVVERAGNDGRRRNTISHECGHLVFDALFEPERLNLIPPTDRDARAAVMRERIGRQYAALQALHRRIGLERLCDRFGYELIFPKSIADESIKSLESLEDLRQMCREHHLTFASAVCRANDLGAQCVLLHLNLGARGNWIPSMCVGIHTMPGERVTLEPESEAAITSLAARSVGQFEVVVMVGAGRRRIALDAEVRRGGDGKAMLWSSKRLADADPGWNWGR